MRAHVWLPCAMALLLAPAAGWADTKGTDAFITQQPTDQWLASRFIRQPVVNQAGDKVGDIADLLFDKEGRIANVVIGVGGFLGLGEKNVAIPYASLNISYTADGTRVVMIALTREQLQSAPDFKQIEKTVFMRAKEQAGDIETKK